jgi:photosystem II stability/assembly factor-like uncharacterized protein
MKNLVWPLLFLACNAFSQNSFTDIIDSHNELYGLSPYSVRIFNANTFWFTGRSQYEKEKGPHWVSENGGQTIKSPLFIEKWKRASPYALTAKELMYGVHDSVFKSVDGGKSFSQVVVNGDTIRRFGAYQDFEFLVSNDSVYLSNRLKNSLILTNLKISDLSFDNKFRNYNSYSNGDTLVVYRSLTSTYYYSVDKGSTWRRSNVYIQPNQILYLSTYHLNAKTSYSIHHDSLFVYWRDDLTGRVSKTQRIQIDSISEIRDIHFFNKNSGILLDNLSRLYKTDDGGETWSLMHRFNRYPVFSIQALSTKTFFIIGYNSIYKTTNWGAKLEIEEISGNENQFKAFQSGKNEISFVGEWQKPMDVNIYDLSGKMLLSKSISEKEVLNHNLPNGVYLIQGIQSGELLLAQKLVIQ